MNHIIFEMTEQHLAIIRCLDFTSEQLANLGKGDAKTKKTPFKDFLGDKNLVEYLAHILVGKKPTTLEFDKKTQEALKYIEDTEPTKLIKIYSEVPMAMDIIFNTQSFELGSYIRRRNEIDWEKYNPNKWGD